MKKIIAALLLSAASLPSFAQERFLEQMEQARKFDISESWKSARIYAPNTSSTISLEKFAELNPRNVVVHLHGCAGIGQDEVSWARYLSSNDFFVVLPDSLAIPERSRNCDVRSNTRNANNVPVGPLRVNEARYALEQIRKISSIQNVFLMGHSEGGATILLAPMTNFKGVVSIGSFCVGPRVNISNEVPLLLINHQSDPWFRDVRYLCDEKTAHRKENTQTLVLSGAGHEASRNSEAQKTVLEFLTRLAR